MSASFSLALDQSFDTRRGARQAWAETARGPAEVAPGPGGQALHFLADSEIFADGDECVSFYRVVSGVVRTCKFRSDGRRQIDAFYLPGDVFGFEAGARHALCAEAVSEASVIAYRWRGADSLPVDDRAAQQLFAAALHELRRAQDHSLLLGRRSAFQKVAAFLIDMIERSPYEDSVELAMSRQDIADYLGLTIETVSRTLSQFEREEAIALPSARRVRVLDRAALRHAAA
ncbi:helix-turn-helix domain-containing protein [Methylocella sp.]|uniref:helix-turn-helix domain-containing protein n=1 Tax=Methylocella sp. TaxID=1978226 RepID=UPI0037846ED0